MSGNFTSTLQKYVGKFTALKGITALKDGIIATMPITLVGSIFLLLSSLPINGYDEFMAGIFGVGWADPFLQVSGATFDLIAIIAVFSIAYSYAKYSKAEPLSCGILALVNFIILLPSFVVSDGGETVGGVIPKTWSGGSGIIGSIIIGLAVAAIYCWCNDKNLKIKMPDSVPEGVSNAFSALIPGFITITISFIIYAVLKAFAGQTLIEVIYTTLQIPLQGLTDSFAGIVIIAFLVSFFWVFGIHGNTLVGGIVEPLLIANALSNQAILDAGQQLLVSEGAKIVTIQIRNNFMTISGSGVTIGLVLAAMFFAKSQQYKQLGRVSIVPGLFNINEPVIFGFPVVMNPKLAIPFILVPIAAVTLTYVAIATGFIVPFAGVQLPWTTPPIIGGFILAGFKGALLQIVIIAISFFAYFPFFKSMDAQAYAAEQNSNSDDDDFDDFD